MKKPMIQIIIIVIFSIILFIVAYYFTINQFMIDLKGHPLLEVQEYSKKNHLLLIIKEEYSDIIKKDLIIKQSISANTKIKNNDKLVVTVSKGFDMTKLYKEYGVNELGLIPIMMYHGIYNTDDTKYIGGNVDALGYHRTAAAFKNDLEFYYQNNYRMIRLIDYVNGKIDVVIGGSPIVLTFDDGKDNNILVTGLDKQGNIIIDPNSAVGILESFKKKYPDYKVTATFFLNGGLFNQPQYNNKILNWLINNGYDIGNHTYAHLDLSKLTGADVSKQVGLMYKLLNDVIPNQCVNIVALPFGLPNKIDNPNFPFILKSNYNNIEYTTISTLRVGWESNYSPFSQKFDQRFIKRIRAYDNNGIEFDITMNFNRLKNNRYISDGNIDKIVVLKENVPLISKTNTLEVISY